MIDYGADIKETAKTVDLKEITALANQQLDLEAKIAKVEDLLKELKESHRKLSQDTLPAAMQQVGQKSFELFNGAKILLTEGLVMSLTGPKKDVAIKWLRSIGESGMIKNAATFDLGTGKAAQQAATKLAQMSKSLKLPLLISEDVNTTSVKALVKRRMEKKLPIPPLADIGAVELKQSVIKL